MLSIKLAIFVVAALVPGESKTWLHANGNSSGTYALINSVLGGTAVEVPDCVHDVPHITQKIDGELNRPVFSFHAHVTPDNDRCQTFDRQRVEIKTYASSPEELKGFEGETVTLSWNFRLDIGFQASGSFTHIHQIKGVGGDDSLPLLTLTPRKRSGTQILELIYTGRDGVATVVHSESLDKFVGSWVHVREELTYSSSGQYSVVLTRTDNGEPLTSFTNNSIDLWRDGAQFMRPKWGIYRSLLRASELRDEEVGFDSFCIGKGAGDKCT